VSSASTFATTLDAITVSAFDLDADGELTNSETYPTLDHGFTLELPAGRYDVELTDANDHLIARWPEIVVDGTVVLPELTRAGRRRATAAP